MNFLLLTSYHFTCLPGKVVFKLIFTMDLVTFLNNHQNKIFYASIVRMANTKFWEVILGEVVKG